MQGTGGKGNAGKGKAVMRRKDQGYTMIIVMCLMFLFMALALSMLFSSAALLARAERAAAQKQCRASAISFAEWMDKELQKEPEEDNVTGTQKNLCANIKKKFVDGSWPAYTGEPGHEAEVAVLTYAVKNGSGGTGGFPEKDFGKVEVKMYWETEEGGTDPKDPQTDLVATVKVTLRGEQFSVTTRYAKDINTIPEDAAEDAEIRIWNGWNYKWNIRGRE